MEPAVALTLDNLPFEVLDTIVNCLDVEGGHNRPGSRKRVVPPRSLGCLAVANRRLRLCCVDRADGVWQKHEQAAFASWPQHRIHVPADNATAYMRYTTHMSTRVRLKTAVWARTKPPSCGSIPIRLPVNSGCSDDKIQSICRQLSVVLRPNAPDEGWLLSQLPLELIELWRTVDGQPRMTTFHQEQLIIPGFRLMGLSEIATELNGGPVDNDTPSFAAGGGGGLGGDWFSALAPDTSAPFVELPLTAPNGIQRYTVRFPWTAREIGAWQVSASVRLRGMIGDGQEKAASLVEFFCRLS